MENINIMSAANLNGTLCSFVDTNPCIMFIFLEERLTGGTAYVVCGFRFKTVLNVQETQKVIKKPFVLNIL